MFFFEWIKVYSSVVNVIQFHFPESFFAHCRIYQFSSLNLKARQLLLKNGKKFLIVNTIFATNFVWFLYYRDSTDFRCFVRKISRLPEVIGSTKKGGKILFLSLRVNQKGFDNWLRNMIRGTQEFWVFFFFWGSYINSLCVASICHLAKRDFEW